jgi:hypothetical protein
MKAAAVERRTMAKLLPMAIRVEMRTKEVIRGMRTKEPPWPTRPPRRPTLSAVKTALARLKLT